MICKGTILIQEKGEGTKSEGLYAYLETEEQTYRLYRDGVYPINDAFFFPFNGMTVDVEGEVTDLWLAARSITVWCHDSSDMEKETATDENVEQKEDDEKDMQ